MVSSKHQKHIKHETVPHKLCRFLELPAELRNHIYGLVFSRSVTRLFTRNIGIKHGIYSSVSGTTVVGLPGLLAAKKQIRGEAILVFYSVTRFRAGDALLLAKWWRTLPDDEWAAVMDHRQV